MFILWDCVLCWTLSAHENSSLQRSGQPAPAQLNPRKPRLGFVHDAYDVQRPIPSAELGRPTAVCLIEKMADYADMILRKVRTEFAGMGIF